MVASDASFLEGYFNILQVTPKKTYFLEMIGGILSRNEGILLSTYFIDPPKIDR